MGLGVNWKLPLWGCFDDIGACIITWILPCWTAGKVADSVGEDCLMCGIASVLPVVYGYFRYQIRRKVVGRNMIDESELISFLISCFIPICGSMQERAQQGVDVMPKSSDIPRV